MEIQTYTYILSDTQGGISRSSFTHTYIHTWEHKRGEERSRSSLIHTYTHTSIDVETQERE